MGRLDGFSYRDVAARLRKFGLIPSGRQKGSHEIWINPATGRIAVVPRHARDMRSGTLRSILRQAGIGIDDFLA